MLVNLKKLSKSGAYISHEILESLIRRQGSDQAIEECRNKEETVAGQFALNKHFSVTSVSLHYLSPYINSLTDWPGR